MARALNEADSNKKKLIVEAQDLTRQIEEGENQNTMHNCRSSVEQLESTKRLGHGGRQGQGPRLSANQIQELDDQVQKPPHMQMQ